MTEAFDQIEAAKADITTILNFVLPFHRRANDPDFSAVARLELADLTPDMLDALAGALELNANI
jgi:hypothetical protein